MRLPILLLSSLSLLIPASAAPAPEARAGQPLLRPCPNTVVFDPDRMVKTASEVSQGQHGAELAELLSHADPYLSKGPWTVTSKTLPVPDGSP